MSLRAPIPVLLALLPACAAMELGKTECFSIADCARDSVCFLGNCVDPGYGISEVYADLAPPTESPWLQQQLPTPLRLEAGLQEVMLEGTVTFSGKIRSADQEELGGTLWAFADGSIHEIAHQAAVTDEGFSLKVTPGEYRVRFVPAAVTAEINARPPTDLGTRGLVGDVEEDLAYPAATDLVGIIGTVTKSEAVLTEVVGAFVVGVARDASGIELDSTKSLTDENGEYHLVFPPGAQEFDITVRPGSNPLVPEATVAGLTIEEPPNRLPKIVLGVGPERHIKVVVRDPQGFAVAGATVIFEGRVGTGDVEGAFSTEATTDANGETPSEQQGLKLLPGDYTVTVAPPVSQTLALSTTALTVTSDSPASEEPVELKVDYKIGLSGTVRSHLGEPVEHARVSATLRDAPEQRQYTATSESDGTYLMFVDPPAADEFVEYELVVEPERVSGLPRHRELIRVEQVAAVGQIKRDVRLHGPTFIYGTVLDPYGEPVPGVSISFYSRKLGTAEKPLLVGVGQTTLDGEFVVPLPTNGS